MNLVVGQQIQLDGEYGVVSTIAERACGELFQVRSGDQPPQVLKVPRPRHDANSRSLVHQEGDALSTIGDHPNIVQLLGRGATDAVPWLRMELLERRVPFDQQSKAAAVAELADLCLALAAAHGHGIVHRDLDPSNIMRLGDTWKIIDWGAAYLPGSAVPDAVLAPLHTPSVSAPETSRGTVSDTRSDLYSLGCCFFWFLTRNFPYGEVGTRAELAERHANRPIPQIADRIPGIHAAYQNLLDGLLAKAPGGRIPAAGEVRERLLALPPLP